MIDLKVHIYSLVAVFLALAVGIVVGSSFSTRPVAQQSGKLSRMERMVRQLEHDFAVVREEMTRKQNQIQDLQAAAERSESFSRAVMPAVLKNRLAWRNAAIIQTGGYDLCGQIKSALELSGAQVTSITRIVKPRVFEDPEAVRDLIARIGLPQSPRSKHASSPVFQAIAAALVSARDPNKLAALEELGIISRSGDYTRWNGLVILLGGGTKLGANSPETVDIPLIEELRKAGVVVVGCEPSDAVESFIKAYRKTGIATVDNVDKAAGQVALVCALAGESGHFGVKPTADRFLPASLEGRHR